MKKIKKILTTLIVCLLTFYCTTHIKAESNQTNFDFRQTSWGMTKEEVYKSEKLKPIEHPDNINNQLLYNTKIENKNCILFYSFNNNQQLISAGYFFDTFHINTKDYISDYQDIKLLLIEKYKHPKFSKLNWKNDLFKYDPDKWDIALSIGDLQFQSMWETENSIILLSLYGENLNVVLGLMYRDINYKEDNNNNNNTEGL